jgi:hypothetical protein
MVLVLSTFKLIFTVFFRWRSHLLAFYGLKRIIGKQCERIPISSARYDADLLPVRFKHFMPGAKPRPVAKTR